MHTTSRQISDGDVAAGVGAACVPESVPAAAAGADV
jgi:hypothetical protein